MEFCPVCMLRKGLAGGVESGESTFEEAVRPTPDQPPQRFEHYELVTGEDGKPVELGRGAMGVTYKALHVDLHCPVTLKVISERYLGDESARLRFLREARAAASLRHPNVASVFHLGKTGENYFYAMELCGVELDEANSPDCNCEFPNCLASSFPRYLAYDARNRRGQIIWKLTKMLRLTRKSMEWYSWRLVC